MRDDQAVPVRRARSALVRMPPVHHRSRTVEAAMKEPLVGLNHEAGRNFSLGVGQHAVRGDDGISFDARGSGHKGLAHIGK